jgi:RNA recognition motif-containing protein
MSYSPRQRYSPPPRRSSRSRSRSPARSYRERHEDVENPGNNLYVTGLSIRVTEKDLEKYFAKVGEVIEARLVVDPRTRESRGFGFVTMSRVKDADRCIRHLHGSTLEGRIITVEKVRIARLQTNGNFWWQHGIYSHEKLQLGCKQRE